jgi:hypothetical protein
MKTYHFRLKTYNGEPYHSKHFFILSKGENAGKPSKTPFVNSFLIDTNYPHAYEILFCLYVSGEFKKFLVGSVIPFIRVREIRPRLRLALSAFYQDEARAEKLKKLEALTLIQKELLRMQQQHRKMKELEKAFSKSIILLNH